MYYLEDWTVDDFEEMRNRQHQKNKRKKEIDEIKKINGVLEAEEDYF
jgi:hypothetical protein